MNDASRPRPDRSDATDAAYWRALEQGSLEFQRCLSCGSSWLPPQPECPNCLSPDYRWQHASGRGRILASTVFHRPYHVAFEGLVPYSVSLVELAEGPRLLTNITGADIARAPSPGSAVELDIVRRDGLALACFRLGDP